MQDNDSVKPFLILLLKGDLAILAGLGTLLTIMNYGGSDVVGPAASMKAPAALIAVAGVLVLLLLGAIVAVESDSSLSFPSYSYLPSVTIGVLTAIHVLVAGVVMFEVNSLIADRKKNTKNDYAVQYLGRVLGAWYLEMNKLPAGPKELYRGDMGRQLAERLDIVGVDTVGYKKSGEFGWRLTFPGNDGRLGTEDDEMRVGQISKTPGGWNPEEVKYDFD